MIYLFFVDTDWRSFPTNKLVDPTIKWGLKYMVPNTGLLSSVKTTLENGGMLPHGAARIKKIKAPTSEFYQHLAQPPKHGDTIQKKNHRSVGRTLANLSLNGTLRSPTAGPSLFGSTTPGMATSNDIGSSATKKGSKRAHYMI